MRCSPRLSVAAASAGLLLVAGGLSAQLAHQGNDALSALAFADARFRPASAIVPIEEVAQTFIASAVQARWDDFQAASPVRWQAYIDRRTGRLESAVGGGIPWIPGSGNSLNGPEARLETLEAVARAFLPRLAPILGVDPAALVLNLGRSGRQGDNLWYVDFDVRMTGMTVEGARVVFRVSHGNLIEIGGENLPSPAAVVPVAAVSREQALAALSDYVPGLGPDDILSDTGSLHLLPANLAAPQFADGFEPGNGRGLALVWEVVFQRRGLTGTWRARVDAESGRILELLDLNSYGRVTGGVYPRSPATTPETELGMPFALVTNVNVVGFTDLISVYTDSNGVFSLPNNTIYQSSLFGKYVAISNRCGWTLQRSDFAQNIRFGTSPPGTGCDTPSAPLPGTVGNGNTHASRSQYYHLNLIKEVGRNWLPSNTWLQGILTTYVDLEKIVDANGEKQTCFASWNSGYGTVNFTGATSGSCANPGEIADISYHEYGHGLDQNDGNGSSPDKGTGETYGDFTAALMTHDSCIGPGFRPTNCSDGYSCTACTGARDIDYAKHSPDRPATVANTQLKCSGLDDSYLGPCGREGHCESQVSSEALWDFVARDLPHPGSAAAWAVAERLWYLSRSTATAAFTCDTSPEPAIWTSSGCATGSLWRTLRAVDDDDGDLTNGTPHSCQLFAAFDRHGIACATDPGATVCSAATAPPASPALTLSTPQPGQIKASWTRSGESAGGSASQTGVLYDVYRSDLGCGRGFVRIAENLPTSPYIDTAVAAGSTYSYQVVAHLAGCSACASAPSSCQSATVAQPPCPSLPVPAGLAVKGVTISAIGLSWGAVSGVDGYNIYRATSSGGPYTLVATFFAPDEFWDNRLGGNSTYFYKARSFSNACESADSNIVTATTGLCKPVSYKTDFETGSGLAGWTALNFVAGGTTVDWRGIQSCSPARSGNQIFRFGGSTCGGTYGNNVAALAATPAIAVPAGAGITQLSFWHRRDFEANYDGGLVSVAFDGQTTFRVVHDWDLSGERYDNSIATPSDRLGGGNCPLGEFGGFRVFSGTKSTLAKTVVLLDGNCDDYLNSQGLRVGCGGHTIQPGFFAVSDCVQGGTGWFLDDVEVTTCAPMSAMDFYTITPCRLLDTRQAAGPLGGPALPAGASRTFTLSGACGIPATAQTLSINLTVVTPGGAGHLQIYPGGLSAPVTSSINFAQGQTLANNGLITLAPDGTGTITVKSGASGPVDFVIDVNGYFQ